MREDARERAELCDLMLEVGPEAPTLCAGWAVIDLAAHLVVRERDPRGGLVILGGDRFAGLERTLMDRARGRGLPALVDRLRAGPPPVPWRLPGLRATLNLNEWFVHHEDVRRAGAGPREPRTDRDDLDAALWRQVRLASRFLLARVRGAGVALVAPGYGEVAARDSGPVARLTGSPQELALYLNGRRDVARVALEGDPEATAALSSARLGI